jgi:hypothetical protein
MREDVAIIIGTLQVAKGHHFLKLNLIGIVDADQGRRLLDAMLSPAAFPAGNSVHFPPSVSPPPMSRRT